MNITTVATPLGPLTIVATDTGAVRTAGFTDDVRALLPADLRADARSRPNLGPITDAVHSYLDGNLSALDDVPVDQPSAGEFLDHVHHTLRLVKPGEPVTYTQLATRAGRPAAVRAAAAGCARNAVALFVPCHRVVRADGGLGGYRWGVDIKRWLLRHEQASRHR